LKNKLKLLIEPPMLDLASDRQTYEPSDVIRGLE